MLKVEYVAITAIIPYARNAKRHPKKQVGQIAASILANGFTNPILVDEDSVVLAGHGRLAAANQLGLDVVPCIRLTGLTSSKKKAYRLADNKLASNSSFDEELLASEFQILWEEDKDFDLALTGFAASEIDSLLDKHHVGDPGDPAEEQIPKPKPKLLVSRLGDVWQAGPHRILCGDALNAACYEQLLGSDRASAVFTDPPYNVPIMGHVGGSGAIKPREFLEASGEMSSAEFTEFLRTAFRNLVAHSVDGSIHFVAMDWRHIGELLAAGSNVYSEIKNLCVWAKSNGGMGTFYRSRHELFFVFKAGNGPHINNFQLGQHGRYRTNVWEYRGANSFGRGRMNDLEMHPTVKPVEMIADAIRDVTQRNGIVLDAFGGSGSTLIAAHKTGRRARLIELDPLYVDVIIRRWQAYAHDDAILVSTGQTFDDIEKSRRLDDLPCGLTVATTSTGDAEPSPTAAAAASTTVGKDSDHV